LTHHYDQDELTARSRQRILQFYRKGTTSRWLAALEAARVVGEGLEEQTAGIAADLKLSPDQVENLACAGRTYWALRKLMGSNASYPDFKRAHSKLTLSHFTAVGRFLEDRQGRNTKPFDWETAMQLLLDCERDDLSSRQLNIHLQKEYRHDGREEWQKHQVKAEESLHALSNDYGVPAILRRVAILFLKISNRYE